jgi:hypothetical protein
VDPDTASTIGYQLVTPSYYEDEDARGGMDVKLTGPVGFSAEYLWDWSWIDSGRSSMPKGVYTFTAAYEEGSHWHCSRYNPNGCTWYPSEQNVAKFKFRWDGSKITVTPSRQAKTKISTVAGKKAQKTANLVVKGRVKVQRRSTVNFQPVGKYRVAKGVKVQLQRYDPIFAE